MQQVRHTFYYGYSRTPFDAAVYTLSFYHCSFLATADFVVIITALTYCSYLYCSRYHRHHFDCYCLFVMIT